MGRHHKFLKLVAIFVIFCMLAQDAALAAQNVPRATNHEPRVITSSVGDGSSGVSGLPRGDAGLLSIPKKFGSIDESFEGSNGKHITFILDAHDSLEAQENIARLIQHMVHTQGIQTVFEEGYEGELNTDLWFGEIEDKKIKRKVSYYYLDQLKIGAAEYAHINRGKNFKLIGVDNKQAYLENIDAYGESKKVSKQILEDVKTIEGELNGVISKTFSDVEQKWIKAYTKYKSKDLPLFTYISRWLEHVPEDECLLLRQIMTAQENESALMALQHTKTAQLLAEINQFNDLLEAKFMSTQDKKDIWRAIQMMNQVKLLAELKIRSDQLGELEKLLKALDTEKLAKLIAKTKQNAVVISKRWETVIQKAMRFYEIAAKRDEAVKESVLKWSRETQESEAVLVFGGFHRSNITQTLRENGFSYRVIIPKISLMSTRHQSLYLQSMSTGLSPQVKAQSLRVHAARPLSSFYESSFGADIQQVALLARENPKFDLLGFALFAEKELSTTAARGRAGQKRSRPSASANTRRLLSSVARSESRGDKSIQEQLLNKESIARLNQIFESIPELEGLQVERADAKRFALQFKPQTTQPFIYVKTEAALIDGRFIVTNFGSGFKHADVGVLPASKKGITKNKIGSAIVEAFWEFFEEKHIEEIRIKARYVGSYEFFARVIKERALDGWDVASEKDDNPMVVVRRSESRNQAKEKILQVGKLYHEAAKPLRSQYNVTLHSFSHNPRAAIIAGGEMIQAALDYVDGGNKETLYVAPLAGLDFQVAQHGRRVLAFNQDENDAIYRSQLIEEIYKDQAEDIVNQVTLNTATFPEDAFIKSTYEKYLGENRGPKIFVFKGFFAYLGVYQLASKQTGDTHELDEKFREFFTYLVEELMQEGDQILFLDQDDVDKAKAIFEGNNLGKIDELYTLPTYRDWGHTRVIQSNKHYLLPTAVAVFKKEARSEARGNSENVSYEGSKFEAGVDNIAALSKISSLLNRSIENPNIYKTIDLSLKSMKPFKPDYIDPAMTVSHWAWALAQSIIGGERAVNFLKEEIKRVSLLEKEGVLLKDKPMSLFFDAWAPGYLEVLLEALWLVKESNSKISRVKERALQELSKNEVNSGKLFELIQWMIKNPYRSKKDSTSENHVILFSHALTRHRSPDNHDFISSVELDKTKMLQAFHEKALGPSNARSESRDQESIPGEFKKRLNKVLIGTLLGVIAFFTAYMTGWFDWYIEIKNAHPFKALFYWPAATLDMMSGFIMWGISDMVGQYLNQGSKIKPKQTAVVAFFGIFQGVFTHLLLNVPDLLPTFFIPSLHNLFRTGVVLVGGLGISVLFVRAISMGRKWFGVGEYSEKQELKKSSDVILIKLFVAPVKTYVVVNVLPLAARVISEQAWDFFMTGFGAYLMNRRDDLFSSKLFQYLSKFKNSKSEVSTHENKRQSIEPSKVFFKDADFLKAIEYFNQVILKTGDKNEPQAMDWEKLITLYEKIRGDAENSDYDEGERQLRLSHQTKDWAIEWLKKINLLFSDQEPQSILDFTVDFYRDSSEGNGRKQIFEGKVGFQRVRQPKKDGASSENHPANGHHRLSWFLMNFFLIRNGYEPFYFKDEAEYLKIPVHYFNWDGRKRLSKLLQERVFNHSASRSESRSPADAMHAQLMGEGELVDKQRFENGFHSQTYQFPVLSRDASLPRSVAEAFRRMVEVPIFFNEWYDDSFRLNLIFNDKQQLIAIFPEKTRGSYYVELYDYGIEFPVDTTSIEARRTHITNAIPTKKWLRRLGKSRRVQKFSNQFAPYAQIDFQGSLLHPQYAAYEWLPHFADHNIVKKSTYSWVTPILPTVFPINVKQHKMLDRAYYEEIYTQTQESDDVLVVGVGSGGADLSIAALKNPNSLDATDVNPVAVLNAQMTARINEFNARVKQSNHLFTFEGQPIFDGKKYDLIIWNMPEYSRAKEFPETSQDRWDGDQNGALLNEFLKELPQRIKPGGRVVLWNSPKRHILKTLMRGGKRKQKNWPFTVEQIGDKESRIYLLTHNRSESRMTKEAINQYLEEHREELLMDEIYHKENYPELLEITLAWVEFSLLNPKLAEKFKNARQGGAFARSPYQWLESAAKQYGLSKKSKILDIGSGNGLAALAFHIITGAEVTSIEIDDDRYEFLIAFIEFLKNDKGIHYPKVKFKKVDFLKHFIGAYDFIYFFFTSPQNIKAPNFGAEIIKHLGKGMKKNSVFVSPLFEFLEGQLAYSEEAKEAVYELGGLDFEEVVLMDSILPITAVALKPSQRSESRSSMPDYSFKDGVDIEHAEHFVRVQDFYFVRPEVNIENLPRVDKNNIIYDYGLKQAPDGTMTFQYSAHTAMAILQMLEHRNRIQGNAFVDLGSSRGVLSILASRLGATKVVAVEKVESVEAIRFFRLAQAKNQVTNVTLLKSTIEDALQRFVLETQGTVPVFILNQDALTGSQILSKWLPKVDLPRAFVIYTGVTDKTIPNISRAMRGWVKSEKYSNINITKQSLATEGRNIFAMTVELSNNARPESRSVTYEQSIGREFDSDLLQELIAVRSQSSLPDMTVEALRAYIYYTNKDWIVVLARNDEGEMIGAVMGYENKEGDAFLSWIVVDEKHQGEGIGRKLLKAFATAAEEKQLTNISLNAKTGSREKMTYLRYGFRQELSRDNYDLMLVPVKTFLAIDKIKALEIDIKRSESRSSLVEKEAQYQKIVNQALSRVSQKLQGEEFIEIQTGLSQAEEKRLDEELRELTAYFAKQGDLNKAAIMFWLIEDDETAIQFAGKINSLQALGQRRSEMIEPLSQSPLKTQAQVAKTYGAVSKLIMSYQELANMSHENFLAFYKFFYSNQDLQLSLYGAAGSEEETRVSLLEAVPSAESGRVSFFLNQASAARGRSDIIELSSVAGSRMVGEKKIMMADIRTLEGLASGFLAALGMEYEELEGFVRVTSAIEISRFFEFLTWQVFATSA